jgi:hypothetical protein
MNRLFAAVREHAKCVVVLLTNETRRVSGRVPCTRFRTGQLLEQQEFPS